MTQSISDADGPVPGDDDGDDDNDSIAAPPLQDLLSPMEIRKIRIKRKMEKERKREIMLKEGVMHLTADLH